MNKTLLGTALLLAGANSVAAQDTNFTWEGTAEFGIDSTISADDSANELTDTYLTLDVAFEAALSARVSAFGALTLESVTDATDDRVFDDLGLYVGELGLRFALGDAALSIGKISPVFGVAWDAAPGFYGTTLAEDYELSEMIGASIDTPIGAAGGVLSFAAFYVDDTGLSKSLGTDRGRTSSLDGGVGNTGKLDNFALQYTQEFGDTTAWIGARHLSAGFGDTTDETGVVIGAAHDFGDGFEMIGEIARFDGAGGASGQATYATLGAAYAVNAWTYSATAAMIDASGSSTDSMLALGADREISDTIELNLGLARFDVGGESSTSAAVAVVFSF